MSKITHEQAREHLKDKIKDANINMVLSYITQQEKQHNLLELYRELNNKILHTYDMFGRMTNKEWAKFGNLQQQIKEQEDETNNI